MQENKKKQNNLYKRQTMSTVDELKYIETLLSLYSNWGDKRGQKFRLKLKTCLDFFERMDRDQNKLYYVIKKTVPEWCCNVTESQSHDKKKANTAEGVKEGEPEGKMHHVLC